MGTPASLGGDARGGGGPVGGGPAGGGLVGGGLVGGGQVVGGHRDLGVLVDRDLGVLVDRPQGHRVALPGSQGRAQLDCRALGTGMSEGQVGRFALVEVAVLGWGSTSFTGSEPPCRTDPL